MDKLTVVYQTSETAIQTYTYEGCIAQIEESGALSVRSLASIIGGFSRAGWTNFYYGERKTSSKPDKA